MWSRLLKILGCALALVMLLSALLHVPVVQRSVVKAASNWATEASGLRVDLERIAIHWWKGRVAAEGIQVSDQSGTTLVRLESLEIGGVIRFGDTWHMQHFGVHGGQINVPAWQDWSVNQPPSAGAIEFPKIKAHRVQLADLHAILPASLGGGLAQFTLEGGGMDMEASTWHTRADRLNLSWDEGQTSDLIRPPGTLEARGIQAAQTPAGTDLSFESVDGLGWHLAGSAKWRGGNWPIDFAALQWDYAPEEFASWWSGIVPAGYAPWTSVPTSGHLSNAGPTLTISAGHVGRAIEVDHPVTLQWDSTAAFPQSRGRLRLDWSATEQLPGLDTLDVPWQELAAWTGPVALLSVEGGWKKRAALEVTDEGGRPRGALALSEHWNRAEGTLHGVDWNEYGRLASAQFSLDAAESLMDFTTWKWAIDAELAAGEGLPDHVEGEGTVAWESESMQGSMRTSGNGWPGDLAFHAHWKPGDIRLDLTGQLIGIQPINKPWQLHARFEGNWRMNGTDSSSAHLALRNMVLLDGGRPTTFERVDAWLRLRKDEAKLRWESDLGVGDVRGTTDVQAWQQWWQAVQMRSTTTAAPALQADIQIRRFGPIAQLMQWPVQVADGSRLQAQVRPDGVQARFNSTRFRVADWNIEGLQLNIDGWGPEVYANAFAQQVSMEADVLAHSCALDLHGDSLWAADIEWLGWGEQPTRFRLEAGQNRGNWDVFVYEAGVPWLTERLELSSVPARLSWYPESASPWSLSGFQWETPGARLDIQGSVGIRGEANLQLDLELDGLPQWGGLASWPVDLSFARANIELCNLLETPMLSSTGFVEGVRWGDGSLERIAWHADGDESGLQATWEATEGGNSLLSGHGFVPFSTEGTLDHQLEINALPLNWINPLMPTGTVDLLGHISGRAQVQGSLARPQVSGILHTDSARAHIAYLGVDVWLSGSAELAPDLIALDRWTIRDDAGKAALLTGTILHHAFADWNFDLSLDANAEPIHLMSLGRKDNDLFYGEAYVKGDANVSGYANNLRMEARLRTEKGTTFALPLDAASDAKYADFIAFKQEAVEAEKPAQNLSRMRMDLALDITSDASARIIFDESLGDEITGVTQGAINLTIDDFERFNMTGQLEVLEGGYLFTLQNIINKQFEVRPGGTVTWYGDPYAAEIDLHALYGLRTSLDPLLPSEPELPGRTNVELNMGLKGNLMRPEIRFDIAVPDVNTRLQALVESALINEEELNRQVMSLLVLQQFLSPDPTSAVGTTGLQERSTEFLASQIGFWLSQMTQDVDVGVDYGTDASSGEQALAVALSAQLLDDRLHVEGAVGTNHLFGGTTEDLQVQDVRVRYDLPPDGMFQLTGYSTTNPAVTGQTGTSTQGVGIMMHAEFNTFREFWQRIFGRNPS